MVFEQIEQLKREWTDKYVVVDKARPDLARFGPAVGLVRTVNMSGRALVEFDQDNNIGWYDIDVSALRVVDKPEAPAEAKKAAKPAKASKAAKPAAKPAAKKASTADILAAARGKAPAGDKPAADKPAAKKPSGKMSTADVLAATRGKAAAAKEASPVPEAKVEKPASESAPPAEEEAPVEEAQAEGAPAPADKAKPAASGDLPTDTAGILAWCREHDAS